VAITVNRSEKRTQNQKNEREKYQLMKRQDNIEMMITRDRDDIKLWKSIHPKMLTFKPACLFTGCTSFNIACTCFNAIIEFSGTWVSFCDEKLPKI